MAKKWPKSLPLAIFPTFGAIIVSILAVRPKSIFLATFSSDFGRPELSGPMRNTSPNIVQYPFEIVSQRRCHARFALFSNGIAQNIADIHLLHGEHRTSSAHARERSIAHNLAMLKHSNREQKISPKVSCIKFFHFLGRPDPNPGHPGHSLSKATE